jgi:hypothetical protein
MEREVDRLIMVEVIMDLTIGDELLINYPLLKHFFNISSTMRSISLFWA